jgi:magnesium transporter
MIPMKKLLTLKKVSRVHLVNPNDQEIDELVNTYDFHEIIEQDLREINTQNKIDVYDDLIFFVLHFPKFHTHSNKHYSNEFNFILGKNILISVSKHSTSTIEKIRQEYLDDLKTVDEEDKALIISPYYLLYRILDALYDKTIQGLNKFSDDLNSIQDKIFSGKFMDKNLLNRLLIKSRNASFLRNTMDPQGEIIEELNKTTIKLYG